MDPDMWLNKFCVVVGDMTFLEAYHVSGRVLNISVFDGRTNSVVLNHRNAPDVVCAG